MVLAVLEYDGNNKLLSTQENLIINTCKRDHELLITVLQDDAAFTATVSPESSCVQLWAARLQLTAPEYLEQLELAIQLSAQHSANSKQNCNQDTAVTEIDSGSSKKKHRIMPNSEQPEHVFEISSGTLAWKQYFAQKNVHGKRGAIPLEQESMRNAAWCVLREAAHKQWDTLQQLKKLEQHNFTLRKERESAAAVAQQGVVLLDQFRQQTYTKFCHLLNSKKLKIKELTQQLKDFNPASMTASASGVVSQPSTSTREPAPKRSNVRVVSGRAKVAVTAVSPAGTGTNTHDDDDFDDDTDVDDNVQNEDECNTDEEKKLITGRRANASKSKVYGGSGGPITGLNTKSPTRNYDTSSSTSKRKELDLCAFNLNNKKRSNVSDSQNDLFDMSQEEARESLLSNIRPRNEGCEVSKKTAPHCANNEFSVAANASTHLSSLPASSSGANFGVSKRLAYKGSDAASAKDCRRDPETVSFVASLLKRNVRERQAKGYGMPTRLDDFDLASKHLDIDFLSKSPLSCESRTHPSSGYSAANIVYNPTAAGIREGDHFDDMSDPKHHRDFFDESSSEEVLHSTNKTRSHVDCSFSNKSEKIPNSSFSEKHLLCPSESANPMADVEIMDKISTISGVRLKNDTGLSSTSSLVASVVSKAHRRNATTVSQDNIVSIRKAGPEISVDKNQLDDYDEPTEILVVDNCLLENCVSKHIKSINPNKKVIELNDSKTDIKPGCVPNKCDVEQDHSNIDKTNGTGIGLTISAALSGIAGNVLDGSSSSGHFNTDARGHSAMKSSNTRNLAYKKPAPKRPVESSSVTAADQTKTPETKRIKPDSDDLSLPQFRVGSIIEDVFM